MADATDLEVREAGDADTPAVEAVVEAAFGEEGTAVNDVMARLRGVEDMAVELVAVSGDEVVGCVALSRAWLDARERLVDVLVLSPLAVTPGQQGRGIGTRLLDAVPQAAGRLGAPLVSSRATRASMPPANGRPRRTTVSSGPRVASPSPPAGCGSWTATSRG